jgi:hypothetical protein
MVPDPWMTFCISPEGGRGPRSGRFQVLIFETLPGMRAFLRHIRPEMSRVFKDCWAFTDDRTNSVVLARQSCTTRTVSHEMVHVAFLWASRIHLNPENCLKWGHPTHERLAEAICNLIGEFWEKYNRRT